MSGTSSSNTGETGFVELPLDDLELGDLEPKPGDGDYGTINYHLYLAEEVIDKINKLTCPKDKTRLFRYSSKEQTIQEVRSDFKKLLHHMQILEGTHPEQIKRDETGEKTKHPPKPLDESWSTEQSERFDELEQFRDHFGPMIDNLFPNA